MVPFFQKIGGTRDGHRPMKPCGALHDSCDVFLKHEITTN